MNEEEIYVETKYFLLDHDWTPLGGDPPKGTDLTRIEIKKPGEEVQSLKKNADSIINDLVFCKSGKLFLIENKPQFEKSDVEKLNKLVGHRDWRESLLEALKQRNLLEKDSIDLKEKGILSGGDLVKVLAYEGQPKRGLENFVQICWIENEEEPTVKVGNELQELPEPLSSA